MFFSPVDPVGSFYYYWTFAVYLGFLYNAFACVIHVFDDTTRGGFFAGWVGMNTLFDTVYVVDICVNGKLSYMEEGIEVRQWRRLAKRYAKSLPFLFDFLSVLPTDALLLLLGRQYSLLRANRLFKVHRVWDFVERSSVRTNYHNIFRILHIIVICVVIFHWNAAIYFKIGLMRGMNSTEFTAWEFNYVKNSDALFAVCSAEPVEREMCSYNETGRDLDERDSYGEELMHYWTSEK